MARQDLLNQVVDRVNDFNRRMRDIEEKVRNMNARVNNLDESLLDKTQGLNDDIQDLEDELQQVRDRIANLEVDIQELNREKRKFVSSQELDEIENYMKLMNPINSSFVTKSEAEELLEEKSMTEEEIERLVDRKIKSMETENKDNEERKTFGEDGK